MYMYVYIQDVTKRYTPEQMKKLGMTMDVREKIKLGLMGAIPKANKVQFICYYLYVL